MNSDCIVIMGSNMAENHPVGFQWVMEARERGAEVIHVDPRFTRTSAMATKHVGIRAGSDIAFLGGIVNYIIENERWFDEYVKRYTPELVADACGCSVAEFLYVAEALCANSGREKTGAFLYAVAWTQHTVGVQIIRTAAIIQLLLGNEGRPGGGIIALRGHASIQGSTDIPTLYNTLPGYIDVPHIEDEVRLYPWIDHHKTQGGWWNKLDAYFISL